MTRIERLQQTGITRLGSPKRGFRYRHADGRKVSRADLQRIEDLKIPPAWEEVAVSKSATAQLQAVGKDAAGRWQYLYHESHTRRRELKKFMRLIRFTEALPKLRKTLRRDMRRTGLSRERVMASILKILLSCFMRPGSQVYVSENGSYGLTTLRPKHVKVKGETIDFDFPGKSGVRQQQQMKDARVARVVRALLKQPGKQVFKFQNGNGEMVNVTGRNINEYIKEVMGAKFSAKDFRTWAGTLVCASALARVGAEQVDKPTVRKRKVVEAIKETAEALGNTPAVCRSSYVSPVVINSFLKGEIIGEYFESLEDFISFSDRKLHPVEASLLRFLKANLKSYSRAA